MSQIVETDYRSRYADIRGFSRDSQVIVTTHSPDLLDCKWIGPENIRVVLWSEGVTHNQRFQGIADCLRDESC